MHVVLSAEYLHIHVGPKTLKGRAEKTVVQNAKMDGNILNKFSGFQMFQEQTLRRQRRNGLSKNILLDDRFPARRLLCSFGPHLVLEAFQERELRKCCSFLSRFTGAHLGLRCSRQAWRISVTTMPSFQKSPKKLRWPGDSQPLLSWCLSDSRKSPQTCDSKISSASKLDSQIGGFSSGTLIESGNSRKSANQYVRIGPSKSKNLPFWKITFTLGATIRLTLGEIQFTLGESRRF